MAQVLDVVATGLRRVGVSRRKEAENRINNVQNRAKATVEEAHRRERVRHGVWHDGRIDCVAGNGVISELGVGVERFGEDDEDSKYQERHDDKNANVATLSKLDDKVWREREYRSEHDVKALPVVVIKRFGADAKPGKMEVLNSLAEWAAGLVSNRVGSFYMC